MVVIKRDGRRIAIDSKRIIEAIERAVVAALGSGVNDNFVKDDKRTIACFSPKIGAYVASILSIILITSTTSLCEVFCPVSVTQLLKASGRYARSPPFLAS